VAAAVHIGIGGWDYEPWRGSFYPPGLPKAQQLSFASRAVTAIEINATFYKLQRPELFARWAEAVPEGFVFAIKGSRFCTYRKRLAEGEEAVARFCGQGLTELGDKLGPILWQFAATKQFEPEDFAAFLALLPREQAGMRLRHAVEVQHASFQNIAFIRSVREAGVAVCVTDAENSPMIAEASADFVYARLKRSRPEEPTGYSAGELDKWAATIRAWSTGHSDALPRLDPTRPVPREAFVFAIDGAKERAPAAAQALIARLAD
jgi:uncharacterized protein YecE (DUF72 family)